jgi:hypothetical protein
MSKYKYFIVEFFLVGLILALIIGCSGESGSNDIEKEKIITANPVKIRGIENGELSIAGKGEDKIHILKVWGTPYEMGKAHGTLLKKEISEHVPNLIHLTR